MGSDALSKILIVDDNEHQRTALTAVLGDLGERIVHAQSGREALRCVLRDDFAVILLDVNMPGLDGFETAQLIRQRPSSEHTPIIFVTAYTDDARMAQGYSLGAVDYILAPVQPDVLRTKVTVFLDLHRKTQELTRQRESLRKYADQLRRLADASLAINSAQSIQDVLKTAGEAARHIVGARDGGARPTGADPAEDPPAMAPELSATIKGRDGRSFGSIALAHKLDGYFTAEDETILVQLAQMASIAIENLISGEAREANRLKDEFLGVLSHELRTPLQTILIWIRMLRGDLTHEMVTQGLDIIERSARSQQRIIDDLLDVSRIIRGKLQIEIDRVDLSKVIDGALETLRPVAASKQITLECGPPGGDCWVKGDANRLQQIVWNLVANAVKFTPPGGRVGVELKQERAQVRIHVWDTGPGIPLGFLPHVFERFRQADSATTRPHSGLGLGLAIVRHLVELHCGRVEAANGKPPRGALFTVTLPRDPHIPEAVPAQRARQIVPPSGSGAGLRLDGIRVVLVEDDRDARECLALALEQFGAHVVAVDCVAAALTALSESPPDLLLSDLGMPGEDGYALIRKVRELEAGHGSRLPAAALTAYVRAEDRSRALEAGFDVHVYKPIEVAELAAVVSRLARRSNAKAS